jgi:hypothetical protein
MRITDKQGFSTVFVLIPCFMAIGMFSLLTLGVFGTSNDSIVQSVAQKQLKQGQYMTVLEPGFIKHKMDGTSIRSRLPGSDGKRVCSLNKSAMQELALVSGVVQDSTSVKAKTIWYVVVTDQADGRQVSDILGRKSSDVTCVTVSTGRLFFLTSPMDLS